MNLLDLLSIVLFPAHYKKGPFNYCVKALPGELCVSYTPLNQHCCLHFTLLFQGYLNMEALMHDFYSDITVILSG